MENPPNNQRRRYSGMGESSADPFAHILEVEAIPQIDPAHSSDDNSVQINGETKAAPVCRRSKRFTTRSVTIEQPETEAQKKRKRSQRKLPQRKVNDYEKSTNSRMPEEAKGCAKKKITCTVIGGWLNNRQYCRVYSFSNKDTAGRKRKTKRYTFTLSGELENRVILREKIVDEAWLKEHALKPLARIIKRQGWNNLFESEASMFPSPVRKFYANVSFFTENKTLCALSTVNRVEVKLTEELISTILGIPHRGFSAYLESIKAL